MLIKTPTEPGHRSQARRGVFGNAPASTAWNTYLSGSRVKDSPLTVVGVSSVALMSATGTLTIGEGEVRAAPAAFSTGELGAFADISTKPNNLLIGTDSNSVEFTTRALLSEWERVVDEPPRSAWTILRELTGAAEGPEDWASEADHYLYGTPKHDPAPDHE